ncbi:MAG: hypothetical protein D6719_02630 [Candidatus Dadabacteria bacterium]|nr:MAG: hypothetical protein D6719_02630 [Candidatus Dadabacteria bacterium]
MKRDCLAGKMLLLMLGLLLINSSAAMAREVEFENKEIEIRVAPGEPTQVHFPGKISGGFKKKVSAVMLDRKDADLIIFANESLTTAGEAAIVRLEDGRSYPIRIKRATDEKPRDDVVNVTDSRRGLILSSEEEDLPRHKERQYEYAPPSQVSGLMREMVLVAEFGKDSIRGYQMTDKYKGTVVLNDGTLLTTIDKIFIGPNLWGYVLDAQNLLDQTQLLNPATFRLDGTRAISANRWEIAARPLTIEQQISGKDTAKVYVITRPRKTR